MLKKYFKLKTWIVLCIILLIELAFNIVLKSTLLNEKVVFNSLAEKMTMEEINTFLLSFRSNSFLIFLFSLLQPMMLIVLITICINIGTLLLQIKLGFTDISGIVTKAFLIFSFSRIVFMVALSYSGINFFDDINYIPQWSVADLIGSSSLPSWALFPLQLINLFQVAFILLLTYGLNALSPRSYRSWLGLVLYTYGSGLIIMVIIIGFLTAL